MKCKKFSPEWFENKFDQYMKMQTGFADIRNKDGLKIGEKNKKLQRIHSLIQLAKEKNVKLKVFNTVDKEV